MSIFSTAIFTAQDTLRDLISNDDFEGLRKFLTEERADITVDTAHPYRFDLTAGDVNNDYAIDPLTALFIELLQRVLYDLCTKVNYIRLDGCTDYFINGYIVRFDYNPYDVA